jgi:hypothetical protein
MFAGLCAYHRVRARDAREQCICFGVVTWGDVRPAQHNQKGRLLRVRQASCYGLPVRQAMHAYRRVLTLRQANCIVWAC